MSPRRPRPSPIRRRGTVLVLVLAVTSMVGVIGLSSLLAARVEHRGVRDRADAAQAQRLADGALQLLHARLSDDPDWRSHHTHNTWSADEYLDADSTMRYRLQDEADADLADNPDDPARLTVRVAHGRAVRLVSVLVGGGGLGPELVTNGDMEAPSIDFNKTLIAGSVSAYTDSPHGGTRYLQLEGRWIAGDGWEQHLDGLIESGKTYRVSAWMRLEDSAAEVRLGLYQSAGWSNETQTVTAAGTTGWSHVQGDLTPSFTFIPTVATVWGRTSSGNQDIHFDDVSVREVLSGNELVVVRGSYRRELDG